MGTAELCGLKGGRVVSQRNTRCHQAGGMQVILQPGPIEMGSGNDLMACRAVHLWGFPSKKDCPAPRRPCLQDLNLRPQS